MWSKVILIIKDFFGVSFKEARGFIVLFLLVLIVLFVPLYFPLFYNEQPLVVGYPNLDSLLSTIEKDSALIEPEKPPVKLFPFDPNTISKHELTSLGLEPYIASRWINYRDAGGKFEHKEDVLKIYDLTPQWYDQVKGYIVIPVKNTGENTKGNKPDDNLSHDRDEVNHHLTEKPQTSIPAANILFDLNVADTSQLKEVYGIGPVLSARIVKFREGLGGFVTLGQIDEVYGLAPEVASRLRERSFISEGFRPKTISINSVDMAGLSSHPYVDYSTARAIIAYRDQHGSFHNITDLEAVHLVEDSLVVKLTPYLKFE